MPIILLALLAAAMFLANAIEAAAAEMTTTEGEGGGTEGGFLVIKRRRRKKRSTDKNERTMDELEANVLRGTFLFNVILISIDFLFGYFLQTSLVYIQIYAILGIQKGQTEFK